MSYPVNEHVKSSLSYHDHRHDKTQLAQHNPCAIHVIYKHGGRPLSVSVHSQTNRRLQVKAMNSTHGGAGARAVNTQTLAVKQG